MKQFVISAKPAAALSRRANQLLEIIQPDVKRRYKQYKRGGMQGLPMIWRNMMEHLKEQHERSKQQA